jgi:hypothetical protein
MQGLVELAHTRASALRGRRPESAERSVQQRRHAVGRGLSVLSPYQQMRRILHDNRGTERNTLWFVEHTSGCVTDPRGETKPATLRPRRIASLMRLGRGKRSFSFVPGRSSRGQPTHPCRDRGEAPTDQSRCRTKPAVPPRQMLHHRHRRHKVWEAMMPAAMVSLHTARRRLTAAASRTSKTDTSRSTEARSAQGRALSDRS